MDRMNVSEYGTEGYSVVGWFDRDQATSYEQKSTPAKGEGKVTLWRTKGGRWVKHWSALDNGVDQVTYVSAGWAMSWLCEQKHSPNIEDCMASFAAEAKAPSSADDSEGTFGRPKIGPEVKIRLPQELLAAIDHESSLASVSRSEYLRDLLTEHHQDLINDMRRWEALTAEDLQDNPELAEWQPWEALPQWLQYPSNRRNAGRCLSLGGGLWVLAELVDDDEVEYCVKDENEPSKEMGSSNDTQTWPMLDKHVPRCWHHGKNHQTPAAIQHMIDEDAALMAAEDAAYDED